jgi:DNA-binding beta-propeller fold protein YncE
VGPAVSVVSAPSVGRAESSAIAATPAPTDRPATTVKSAQSGPTELCILTTVTVGENPDAVADDFANGDLYVTNSGDFDNAAQFR